MGISKINEEKKSSLVSHQKMARNNISTGRVLNIKKMRNKKSGELQIKSVDKNRKRNGWMDSMN
jgi:hypothetical protein